MNVGGVRYLITAVNQQSAAPIVLVGPVDELLTAIPLVNGMPVMGTSTEKLDEAGTEMGGNVGAVVSAGTVALLKTKMNCCEVLEFYPTRLISVPAEFLMTRLAS